MENITLTGVFDKYAPINDQPHYRFTTSSDAYLISCSDYPSLISKLSPGDLVKISGGVGSRVREGVVLVNVKFGGKNE